ncbi:hypothetical protein R1flu_025870 [Riccia fluitans]|uniref:Uncharacterized protein n=1 Tax=Riccia fluitans TaxID=41844 RepID=A0ABD1XZW6_9MARC
MDRSPEDDLDDVALQVLRFLGEVYVKLQEAEAVEEYVCEQYSASIRFVSRCSSYASNETSSSKDFVKSSSQSTNGNFQAREQREQHVAGADKETSKQEQDLLALCDYIDTVLATAQAVREGCDISITQRKGEDEVQGQKLASSNDKQARVVKHGPVPKSSTGVVKPKSEKNVPCISRNGNKLRRPNSRAPNSGREISQMVVKIRKKLVTGAAADHNKVQARKTSPVHAKQSNVNSHLGPQVRLDSKTASLSKSEEELSAKPTANSRTGERFKLQFPEKYRTLRRWFEARETYRSNIYATPRIRPAAEEAFMSLLDDLNSGQDDDTGDDDYKNAASSIQELQHIMEDMFSCERHFDMLRLHRLAPAGSEIEQLRDFILQHNLSPSEREDGPKVKDEKTDSLEVSNSCWLPQSCWERLDPMLSEQLMQFSYPEFTEGSVAYTEPEQVVAIARLSHRIQETLFHCYLEEVFGPALLHRSPREEDNDQMNMIDLLRCQLAHAILCKEGRGLFVLAERINETV